MKVKIDSREWHPVYVVEEVEESIGVSTVIDVGEKKLARWRRTFKRFDQVQKEIEQATKEGGVVDDGEEKK